MRANIFGCRNIDKTITLGVPVVAYDGYLSVYSNPGDEMEVCQPHETNYDLEISPGCSVNWSQVYVNPGGLSWSPSGYDDLYLHVWKTISCEPNFKVTPNPTKPAISITQLKEANEGGMIEEISIYDFLGRLKFHKKYGGNLQVTMNDLKLKPGTYLLQ